jgi:hypothetical protein
MSAGDVAGAYCVIRAHGIVAGAGMAESSWSRATLSAVFARGWPGGGQETRCGRGSTWQATSRLRQLLPAVLRELAVATLNDAGCGDAHWIRCVDLGGIDYLGYDLVRYACWDELEAHSRLRFAVADFVTERLRPCQLTLCRDALIHGPTAWVLAALANFRQDSRYLLATTFPGTVNAARTIAPGGFARLDLAREPFSLGTPRLLLSERARNKYLGLWELVK